MPHSFVGQFRLGLSSLFLPVQKPLLAVFGSLPAAKNSRPLWIPDPWQQLTGQKQSSISRAADSVSSPRGALQSSPPKHQIRGACRMKLSTFGLVRVCAPLRKTQKTLLRRSMSDNEGFERSIRYVLLMYLSFPSCLSLALSLSLIVPPLLRFLRPSPCVLFYLYTGQMFLLGAE